MKKFKKRTRERLAQYYTKKQNKKNKTKKNPNKQPTQQNKITKKGAIVKKSIWSGVAIKHDNFSNELYIYVNRNHRKYKTTSV